jgi:hypothetical protein
VASFLSYQLPGQLTQTGCKAAAAVSKSQGREPSFVALEGYDAIAVLAHALEHTPDLSAESICSALRAVAAPGTVAWLASRWARGRTTPTVGLAARLRRRPR